MKKLIAIVTVLVMAVVMCVGAFAGASLDRLYVNADVLESSTNLASKSTIQIQPGDKMYILGWAMLAGTNLDYVYYKLDGEAKECDGSNSYLPRNDVAGVLKISTDYAQRSSIGANNAMMELIGIDELEAGSYNIAIIAKFQNGTEEPVKEFTLKVGEVTDKDYTFVYGKGDPFNGAIWLTQDGQSAAVEFGTTVGINSITVDNTWASRADAGIPATVVLNLYAYDTDIDTTMNNAPIATTTFDTVGDNNPACVLKLDTKAPAGTYIFEVMTVGEKMTGNTAEGSAYIVLDGAMTYDAKKVYYIDDVKPFMFSINGDITEGDPMAEIPDGEDIDVPVEVSYRNASFDSFYIFSDQYPSGLLNFGNADGNASDKLDAIGREIGDEYGVITAFILRGWIGFNGCEIEAFGYQIGNDDPVYDANFFQDTEAAVLQAGGAFARRFQILIPVEGITGSQEIVMMVKLTNGDEYAIDEDLEYTPPATAPNTRFTLVVGGGLTGDADGDGEITDWDAIVFERWLAGWNVEIDESLMDIDGDGELSDWDAIVLERWLAGWNVQFGE